MRTILRLLIATLISSVSSGCASKGQHEEISTLPSPYPAYLSQYTASFRVPCPESHSQRPWPPSDTQCPPAHIAPGSKETIFLYDFLPTGIERQYYKRHLKDPRIESYVLLTDPSEKLRSEAFLKAFFSTIGLLSSANAEWTSTVHPDSEINFFYIPVRSVEGLHPWTTLYALGHPAEFDQMAGMLLSSPSGYDWEWARQAFSVFCRSYIELTSTPPCVEQNPRGPYIVIVFNNASVTYPIRVLLVDLSTHQNAEVFQLELRKLIASTGPLQSEEGPSSSYQQQSFEGSALDLLISLQKTADEILRVLPPGWFLAENR